MATYEGIKVINLPAGVDLDDSLHEIVAISRSGTPIGKLVKADANAADANAHLAIGILAMNTGTTAVGDMVPVIPIAAGGIAKVKASAAITVGAGSCAVEHGGQRRWRQQRRKPRSRSARDWHRAPSGICRERDHRGLPRSDCSAALRVVGDFVPSSF